MRAVSRRACLASTMLANSVTHRCWWKLFPSINCSLPSGRYLTLQTQLRAVQQQLAILDANVAALKQRERSATQPGGESARTPQPGPATEADKNKVTFVQSGLGAFWQIPMTNTLVSSQYQHPCPDRDKGTVKKRRTGEGGGGGSLE